MRSWEALPVLEEHEGVRVVRDDLLPGGTKTRFLPALVAGASEVVYGSGFCGGGALALAVVGRELGIPVTLFYAKRAELHPRQRLALTQGAQLYLVPHGYMTNVQAKARRYAADRGARFFALGFDLPDAVAPFADVLEGVRQRVGSPDQIWCATGSGMLARCLAHAFPMSEVCAVAVGLASRWSAQAFPSNVRVLDAGVPFEREERAAAPFPSCPNYDRKAWQRCVREKKGSALFWNVLGQSA